MSTELIEKLAKEILSPAQILDYGAYTLNDNQLLKIAKAYAEATREQDAKDAERYRCLKPKYVMANFDIYDAEEGEQKVSGIIFEMPEGINYGADLDAVVDQAIARAPKKGE